MGPRSPHGTSGTFVTAARGAPLSAERFEDDRPLDQAGWEEVQRAARDLVPLAEAELRYCPRSRATGDALGYAPPAQLALRDCGMGRWRGLTPGEAMAREPQAVDAWLADPRVTPHGGESLLAFIARVGRWLDTRPVEDGGRIVAVTEPSVIRAALVYALKAPPATYWSIDVCALSTTTVTGRAGRWSLRLESGRLSRRARSPSSAPGPSPGRAPATPSASGRRPGP
ncbi:histidine phosphatase family protein [Streptomyces cinereospinus]|uniref:Histidine phosphatase family protein n=1 Tax=Streptomyces cinereospinus TaxID=285561 RepID=A0ABV5N0C3_9ACTN